MPTGGNPSIGKIGEMNEVLTTLLTRVQAAPAIATVMLFIQT
jgi:hypothetical protein